MARLDGGALLGLDVDGDHVDGGVEVFFGRGRLDGGWWGRRRGRWEFLNGGWRRRWWWWRREDPGDAGADGLGAGNGGLEVDALLGGGAVPLVIGH